MNTAQKLNSLYSKAETVQLVEAFEETELNTFDKSLAPIVRGFILEELERRNESAFGEWVDSLEDSPRSFYY